MKIRHPHKVYEYDTKMMVIKTQTRDKLKQLARKENITMMEFVEKLITTYENTSNASIR